MNFTRQLFLTALAFSSFGNELNKIKRKYKNRKPDYYKIDIPKHERKGKTPEEIQQMRIERYEELKCRSKE